MKNPIHIVSILFISWIVSCLAVPCHAAGDAGDNSLLSGRVVDAATREPLAGAILIAKTESGKTVSYCSSVSGGDFKIRLSPSVTEIEVTMMGYTRTSVKAPFEPGLEIGLELSKEKLKASVIKASSVVQQGDTITYSAAALRSKDDSHLGDLLKKIPGIDVTSKGYVMYGGKPINTLYIDGRNVLESNYNFATSNISAQSIKNIEVYQHHQPIKALQDLVDSESAALNIVLTDEARGRLTFTLEAEGGVSGESPAYEASASAIIVAKKYALFNKISGNDIGEESGFTDQSDAIYIGKDRHNIYNVTEWVSTGLYQAPVEKRYSQFNKTFNFQTLDNFATGKEGNLSFVLKGSSDILSSEEQSRRSYLLPGEGEEVVFAEDNSSVVDKKEMTGSLSYTLNSKKIYLRDYLYFDVGRKKSEMENSEVEGILQSATLDALNINNIFNIILRNDKGSLGLYWYSQESFHNSSMFVPSSLLGQDVDNDVAYGYVSMNAISRTLHGWQVKLSPMLTYTLRRFSTSLNYVPIPGEYAASSSLGQSLLIPSLYMDLSRQMRRLKIGADVSARYYWYRSDLPDASCSLPLANVGAYMEYKLGQFDSKLRFNLSNSVTGIQTIGDALILRNYNTLWLGRARYMSLPSYGASLNANYAMPLAGLYFTFNSSFSKSSSFLQSRKVYDDYVLNIASDEVCDGESASASFKISKSLMGLRGKIDFTSSYAGLMSSMVQNGEMSDFRSGTFKADLDFYTNPCNFLTLRYSGNYSDTRYFYDTDMDVTPERSFNENVTVSFLPDRFPELSVNFSHYLVRSSQTVSCFLLDFSVRKKFNSRVEVYAEALNLLDNRTLTCRYSSALLVSEYIYSLRPRTILLGIKLNI